jgi:hypothetical protein
MIRHSSLQPGTRPIPRKRARPRRGPLRDSLYLKWLRSKPCACGCGRTPCQAAHTGNGGMRMKGPDSGCVPLYWRCHRIYDGGRQRFEQERGVNMRQMATAYYAQYLGEYLAGAIL